LDKVDGSPDGLVVISETTGILAAGEPQKFSGGAIPIPSWDTPEHYDSFSYSQQTECEPELGGADWRVASRTGGSTSGIDPRMGRLSFPTDYLGFLIE
jgi:hypothetical protein